MHKQLWFIRSTFEGGICKKEISHTGSIMCFMESFILLYRFHCQILTIKCVRNCICESDPKIEHQWLYAMYFSIKLKIEILRRSVLRLFCMKSTLNKNTKNQHSEKFLF